MVPEPVEQSPNPIASSSSAPVAQQSQAAPREPRSHNFKLQFNASRGAESAGETAAGAGEAAAGAGEAAAGVAEGASALAELAPLALLAL